MRFPVAALQIRRPVGHRRRRVDIISGGRTPEKSTPRMSSATATPRAWARARSTSRFAGGQRHHKSNAPEARDGCDLDQGQDIGLRVGETQRGAVRRDERGEKLIRSPGGGEGERAGPARQTPHRKSSHEPRCSEDQRNHGQLGHQQRDRRYLCQKCEQVQAAEEVRGEGGERGRAPGGAESDQQNRDRRDPGSGPEFAESDGNVVGAGGERYGEEGPHAIVSNSSSRCTIRAKAISGSCANAQIHSPRAASASQWSLLSIDWIGSRSKAATQV